MSVEKVNAHITAAAAALERSNGAEDHDRHVAEIYGMGAAEEKLEELKNEVSVYIICILPPDNYYPMGRSADEAAAELSGLFDGSSRTDQVETVLGAVTAMGEKATEARGYFDVKEAKREEIIGTLGLVASQLDELRQIVQAESAAIDEAAANRNIAIAALGQMYI